MISQNSVEIKTSGNRCKNFFRFCLGGIIGAASGVIMPIAQWLLNIRDRVDEQQPTNRLRWPAILDIGASAVVAYGAIIRFGNPALWCILLVEGCLSIYGFTRGIQITRKSRILDVPKKLWNTEIQQENSEHSKVQKMNIDHKDNSPSQESFSVSITPELYNAQQKNKKSHCKRFCDLIGGSVFGVGAGILMPSVQTFHSIWNAKRRWPPLINGGVLTYYALYVGSIYVGPELSLLLLKRMGQALGIYGLIRGGHIGYQETPRKVFTLMWQGGISHSQRIKSEKLPPLELEVAQRHRTKNECDQHLEITVIEHIKQFSTG